LSEDCELTPQEMVLGLKATFNDAYNGFSTIEELAKLEPKIGRICKCNHYENCHNSSLSGNGYDRKACDLFDICDCVKFEAHFVLERLEKIKGSPVPKCFHCKTKNLEYQSISELGNGYEIQYNCTNCRLRTREAIPGPPQTEISEFSLESKK